MQRLNVSDWIGRAVSAVRALFAVERSAETVPSVDLLAVLATPSPTADAGATHAVTINWMLPARLAVQAKLNVPIGKKARVAPIVSAKRINRRPVEAAVVKRSPKARSVYLQARHSAPKLTLKPKTNVVMLPIAKVAKPALARPNRLAA